MTTAKCADFINWADRQIKEGKGGKVAQALGQINLAKIRPGDAIVFARMARRVGIFSVGLKLLSRNVLSPGRDRIVSTNAKELAEYGALLVKNGSIEEALAVLSTVDHKVCPEALLFEAFTRFTRWEYAQATRLLEDYLTFDLSSYDRLVGQVNLASAYVVTRDDDRAINLLSTTIHEANSSGATRLAANCLEMRAQAFINSGKLERAEEDLERADKIFDNDHDRLFLEKRLAHLHAVRHHDVAPLLEFRGLAMRRRHWESVRDTDFYILKLAPDGERLNHLYFGTPYGAFRKRIEQQLDCRELADSYLYGCKTGRILDLRHGPSEAIREGSQIHRILLVFLRDFYRPVSYGTLFAHVFPGEHYDAYSSPNRLRQSIQRLRNWMEEHHIPACIEHDGDYRMTIAPNMGFYLPRIIAPQDRPQILWQRLHRKWKSSGEISARAAAEVLAIHPAAAKRLLRWAVDNQRAIRIGQGPATRYKKAA